MAAARLLGRMMEKDFGGLPWELIIMPQQLQELLGLEKFLKDSWPPSVMLHFTFAR